MNRIQKSVISVTVPVIVVLIAFVLIGPSYSTNGAVGDHGGIAFNPFLYCSRHGLEWSIVVLLIGLFEILWWKDRKNNRSK